MVSREFLPGWRKRARMPLEGRWGLRYREKCCEDSHWSHTEEPQELAKDDGIEVGKSSEQYFRIT